MVRYLVSALAAACAAGPAVAQDWANPLPITASPYLDARDSCGYPVRTLVIESGFYQVTAPAVIYRVRQWHTRPGSNAPWYLTLSPQTYTDFSLWVCTTHTGDTASGCVDGSDDYGAVPEHAIVPNQFGSYYVIVTGNVENAWPNCGTYVLSATH